MACNESPGATNLTPILYSPLPSEIYGKVASGSVAKDALVRLVTTAVGPGKVVEPKELLLHKTYTTNIRAKKKTRTKFNAKHLSRKARKANNLLTLPKSGWNYESLQGMRDMWSSYMQKWIRSTNGVKKPAPEVTDNGYVHFHTALAKSDLTGANIVVVQSRVPSLIDIEGTIVLETRQTFQVVTPKNELKILLKEPSVFQFQVMGIVFTLYGKALLTRPHERCVKKIKACIDLDL